MASSAALMSLVQLLKDILDRRQYPSFLLNVHQIASLYDKLSSLQTLLDNHTPNYQESIYDLEMRVRDAAHTAQDIIESHISDQISLKDQKPFRHGVMVATASLISIFRKQVPPPLEELEQVKEEVDSIVEELAIRMKGNQPAHEDLQIILPSVKPRIAGTNTLVGFEEHLIAIKEQLCGESSNREVISIVGMGGAGKSTLARNIFDDKLAHDCFVCRVWVTVSQDYHRRKVLLDIMNSLNIEKNELDKFGDGELIEKIYKHLKGRQYLMVMDDMWDMQVWDDVKKVLPDDHNGSRVITTTRLINVAAYASNSRFIHHLQLLDEYQSWNLFCKKVFCPPELERIGRVIARHCRGLPLAIVVVAGLLSRANMTRYDWEGVSRDISSVIAENDQDFSKILSLSYNHLPNHLKACFLYMGGFPEDHEFSISRLVELWVAEGFVKPTESRSLEEVAEEYLEDLVSRNLVSITQKMYDGKSKRCRIHDLLRDLCVQRAHAENFLHVVSENNYCFPETIRSARHLHIQFRYVNFIEAEKHKHIRSIIELSDSDELLRLALGFKFLRVLETKSPLFPDEIVELFHLRYLAIYASGISTLPPSISKLQNLQTLRIGSRARRLALPSEVWEMPHLRHIIIDKMGLPDVPIDDEAQILENLQTLSRVVNFKFTKRAVEMIPNLKKLKFSCTYEARQGNWKEFCFYNLVHFNKLETLVIEFWIHVTPELLFPPVPFPERFTFPQSLKSLSLRYCKLPWKDMTVVGMLPNLEVLKLRARSFVGEEWEPIEGEFLRLKFLLMERLHGLKNWRAENTHFPRLAHLKINGCQDLESIPYEIGEIPTLELIVVYNSNLAAESALEIQEEQRELGNDLLQVRIGSEPPRHKKQHFEESYDTEWNEEDFLRVIAELGDFEI